MFNSIRTKLTLWYVGVMALVVIVFSASAYFILVSALDRDMDQRLSEMARNFDVTLKAELEDEDRKSGREKTLSDAVNEMRFRDYQFLIATQNGRVIASTAEFGFDPKSQSGTDAFSDIVIDTQPMRVYRSPLTGGQNEYRLLVFRSLNEQLALKSRMAGIFLFGVPLTLLLAGIGGYFLARKSLKPIAEMGNQAKQISASNLHERLPVANRKDELGNLSIVFNDLLDRLDREFDKQRRFMADASHELRTPLAIVRGESEVALSKQDRTPGEYRESLSVVNDEGKRLTKIVEDLFTLARADSGELKTELREVYVDEILADCVRSVRTLADKRNITIEFTSTELPVRADEALLRRLFINLLDNAIKYNVEGGTIRITARDNTVTIANTGPEIAEDKRHLIFERFYRVEKARVGDVETLTSGAGLGLSIAKLIAEIHDAKIKLVSSDKDGTVFAVKFHRT